MTIGIFNVTFIYTYPCLAPDPVFVAVTSDPVSIIEYPNVTLTCTVELSPVVDVPVTVNTVWTGPAGFMIENTAQRVNESNTRYISTAGHSQIFKKKRIWKLYLFSYCHFRVSIH